MQRGDVIIEFDGKAVDDPLNLKNMVAGILPNKKVSIEIIRDGSRKTLTVTISEASGETQTPLEAFDNQLKGVQIQTLSPELRRTLGIPDRTKGIVITDIEEGSPAEGILGRGDVVMEINKHGIEDSKDYEAVVSKIESAQDILLLIYRKGSTLYITLSTGDQH